MWELYKDSFPIYEQRSLENQLKALENEKCEIIGFFNDNEFIGFKIF